MKEEEKEPKKSGTPNEPKQSKKPGLGTVINKGNNTPKSKETLPKQKN